MRSLLLATGLATALSAGLTRAPRIIDAPLAGQADVQFSGYLKPGVLEGEEVIGPPPAPDSPLGQADRTIYLETRGLVGSPRWAEAIRDQDLWNGGAMGRYSCALGAQIGPLTTPVTYRVLRRVEVDVRTVERPVKAHFHRIRPLVGDARPACVKREDWMRTIASYPSGHAMTGWAWGLILGELAPARASELLAAGREVGQSRVVCGVHYESDVEAGRDLGAAMVARLHAEPAFLRDVAVAREELKRPHHPPAHCG